MIEHRLHHDHRPASGTGIHDHHRAVLEHDGVKVGYWRCHAGTPEAPWCPDLPDPNDLLIAKHAAAIIERASRHMPSRDRCRYGHGAEHQTRNRQGSAICLECRRRASLKARLKRAADRVAA